ncbi:MAG: protein-disulfide reductase DsbD family protein [Anaerohalosphaeraceae bacterium]
MKSRTHSILPLLIAVGFCASILNASAGTLITEYEDQSSSASVQMGRMNGKAGIVVVFSGTDDLHYYATPEAAPAPHLALKITARSEGLAFGDTIYPEYHYFNDPAKGKIEVYVGNFKVFLPIKNPEASDKKTNATITIEGIACTSQLCLAPFTKEVTVDFALSQAAGWPEVNFKTVAPETKSGESAAASAVSDQDELDRTVLMLLLALLGGVLFNVMPCVLPVLPLIISRMVNIAKESAGKRIKLGFSFCLGIISFFFIIAVISTAIRLTTGSVFNLSDPYRYPVFDIIMVLFLVIFAMFMFDIFTIVLPSSVTGASATGTGFASSVGMGFLAAILSTPCSGAILAAVLVWAQAQSAMMGFLVFVLLGVGMALPYAVLILVPALLNKIPRPGTWMEQFKKAMGFAMLLLMLKPLSALPKDRILDVLGYAIVLGFAVWMWGTWVTFSTPKKRKQIVRGIALVIAVVAGLYMLPARSSLVQWQSYDRTVINSAISNEQPVLLKFTADWCSNCKVVDKKVFHNKAVVKAIQAKNVLAVKADTTLSNYDASVDLQKIYNIPGTVPITILHLPGKTEPEQITGIYDPETLLRLLEKLE